MPWSSRSRTCSRRSLSSACASAFVPPDLRAVLEQDRDALGALRLGRVVERLAVVGVRACLEQRTCQHRVVADARGAVERGHPTVFVDEERVRIGAARRAAPARGRSCRSTSGTRREGAPSRAAHRRCPGRHATRGRARARSTRLVRARDGRREAAPPSAGGPRSRPGRTSRRSRRPRRRAPPSSGTRARARARAAPARGSARARRAARAPPDRRHAPPSRAPSPACGVAPDSRRPPPSRPGCPRLFGPETRSLCPDRVLRRGGLCPARGPVAPSYAHLDRNPKSSVPVMPADLVRRGRGRRHAPPSVPER